MRRRVLILSFLLLGGFAMWASSGNAGNSAQGGDWNSANTSAAFRDGLFHGKLAAARGASPHLSSARWSRDRDRRAFVVGYMRGYVEKGGAVAIVQPVDKAAYKDGMQDGAQDRDSGQAFRAARQVALAAPSATQCAAAYRDAYFTGYQLAYYGDQDGADALLIWPR